MSSSIAMPDALSIAPSKNESVCAITKTCSSETPGSVPNTFALVRFRRSSIESAQHVALVLADRHRRHGRLVGPFRLEQGIARHAHDRDHHRRAGLVGAVD